MVRSVWMALAVFLSAAPTLASSVSEDEVDMAQEALELLYIQEEIYYPVRCRVAKIEEKTFIRCTGIGSDIGGLYLVEAGPKVYAVNGKAFQHMGRADAGVVRTTDQIPIPIERWPGEPIGIAAVLEAFDAD